MAARSASEIVKYLMANELMSSKIYSKQQEILDDISSIQRDVEVQGQ